VVGFWEILQQTPRAVTVALPSSVTSPPEVAVIAVILLASKTMTVGTVTSFTVVQFSKMSNRIPAKSTLEIADLIFIDFANLITKLITLSYWFLNLPARLGFRYCLVF
jgi:hypothetical protein